MNTVKFIVVFALILMQVLLLFKKVFYFHNYLETPKGKQNVHKDLF